MPRRRPDDDRGRDEPGPTLDLAALEHLFDGPADPTVDLDPGAAAATGEGSHGAGARDNDTA